MHPSLPSNVQPTLSGDVLRFVRFLAASICTFAACTCSAHASLIITAVESGSDVVFSYNGSIDLTGAPSPTGPGSSAFINASAPALSFRDFSAGQADQYNLPSPPPAFSTFGSGAAHVPTSTSGDILRLSGASTPHQISLPVGYTSNTAISGTMTFVGQSFVSLGLTPGDYVWDLTFSGGPAQDATISVVPEPSAVYGMLAFLAIAGSVKLLRKKQNQ